METTKDPRHDSLSMEYSEVASAFRALTDIRFKLLNFLPFVSGATFAVAVSQNLANLGTLALAAFGLIVTIGLTTYNARNDQLYNELVGRAADLERRLGLPDGNYANRPRAWLRLRILGIPWHVNHGEALSLIYTASIALWAALLAMSSATVACQFLMKPSPQWVVARYLESTNSALGLTIAAAMSVVCTMSVRLLVVKSFKARSSFIRDRAARAYRMALERDVVTALNYAPFISLCAELAHGDGIKSDKKLKRCKKHSQCVFLSTCAGVDSCKRKGISVTWFKMQKRAAFYARLSEKTRERYLPSWSKEEQCSHLVGLLTDFPPRWIYDIGEDRTGDSPLPSLRQESRESAT
jgi:hypothetical protein